MTETYQPIYDAVRSRIRNGDVGQAIADVMRKADVGHYFSIATEEIKFAASRHYLPSALYRPSIKIDGDKWCALYGENLQDGVAGFGDSPVEAMADFDVQWHKKLETSS